MAAAFFIDRMIPHVKDIVPSGENRKWEPSWGGALHMAALTWEELIDLAVSMEEQGQAFYGGLAERSGSPETAQILRHLAEEEAQHAEIFRHGLTGPPDGRVPDQAASYLEAIRKRTFFAEDEEAPVDPRKALALGIEAEKEAILFYTELAELITDEKTRVVLYGLLRQEKMHLVELRDRLEEDWS